MIRKTRIDQRALSVMRLTRSRLIWIVCDVKAEVGGNATEELLMNRTANARHLLAAQRFAYARRAANFGLHQSSFSPTEIRFGSDQSVWGNGAGASHFLRGKKVEHSITSRGTA